MSDTYAVVENGVVTNIIIWDGGGEWSPDSGKAVKVKRECGIGWIYDGKSFTPPALGEKDSVSTKFTEVQSKP